MTDPTARETVSQYFEAWTGGDFDRAMDFIAPHIVCHSPAGLIEGAPAFREFMGPFAGMVTSTSQIALFGDDHHAVVMYDTETPVVTDAPGAEWHRVVDGRIAEIRIIFDRLPFELARTAAAGQSPPN